MKGEVMFVSRGQRKGRMEKNLLKWDMQDCHTEGKETGTSMNPATFTEQWEVPGIQRQPL